MAIAKAKLKPLDQMPEWAVCCDGARRLFTRDRNNIFMLDLNETDILINGGCTMCDADKPPNRRGYLDTITNTYIMVDIVDIDEAIQ